MQLSQLPTKIAVAFANSGAKNAIPVPSQIGTVAGAASYTDGFPPLTRTPLAAGGVPPSGADMNGVLYEMSAVERWLCAGGQFKYDAAFSTAIGGYPKSSVLNSTNSDIQWISTADNNVTDPDSTSAAGWVALAGYGIANVTGVTGGTVTLAPAQYGKPVINLTGALTSNAVIVFPANQPLVRVVNNTTGGFTVTCKTAAGTGGTVEQSAQAVFYGDGTNLVPPQVGTAPQFDTTGKGASTAFVQRALGNAQGYGVFATGGSPALAAGDAGKIIVLSGTTAGTLSLPLLASVPEGASFLVKSETLTAWAIAAAGADGAAIVFSSGSFASLPIVSDEFITFVKGGGVWRTYGTGVLKFAGSFAQLLAASGYKKLPGSPNLIMQWGQFVQNDNGGASPFTWVPPIAFPNSALVAQVTAGNFVATGNSSTVEGLNPNSVTGFTLGSTNTRTWRILVIGY